MPNIGCAEHDNVQMTEVLLRYVNQVAYLGRISDLTSDGDRCPTLLLDAKLCLHRVFPFVG
jgi:hypothetical protein